jgi:hypothetical protein
LTGHHGCPLCGRGDDDGLDGVEPVSCLVEDGRALITHSTPRLPSLPRRKIERYGLTGTIDLRHFYPTVEEAVTAFRAETGTEWTAATSPSSG